MSDQDSIEDFDIFHEMTPDEWKRLAVSGAPQSAKLRKDAVLDLVELTQHIDHVRENGARVSRTPAVQLDMLDAFLNNMHRSPLIVISSFPNDRLASQVALYLMLEGLRDFYENDAMKPFRTKRGISKHPLWHPVFSTFNDPVVTSQDRYKHNMYVFSGVPDNATPRKLELLRELLVKTSDLPRVVVTSSANPIAFADQLRIHADAVLWLHDK